MKKRQAQSAPPVSSKGTLDFFFAKSRLKAETPASDDSVVFVKEVKPKDKQIHIVGTRAKSGGNDNTAPVRLKDVLRRRTARLAKNLQTASTDSENLNQLPSLGGAGANALTTSCISSSNEPDKFSSNFNTSPKKNCPSSFQLPDVEPSIRDGVVKPASEEPSLFVRLSPKKSVRTSRSPPATNSVSNLLQLKGIDITESESSKETPLLDLPSTESFTIEEPLAMNGPKNPVDGAATSLDKVNYTTPTNIPSLSLKVLDSQEYYPGDSDHEKEIKDSQQSVSSCSVVTGQ